jgi:hypothetical protein
MVQQQYQNQHWMAYVSSAGTSKLGHCFGHLSPMKEHGRDAR